MRKTDKKLEKKIFQALTNVCETVKVEVQGFEYLTHEVNYKQFPESLSVICFFATKAELNQAQQDNQDQFIFALIKNELVQINIRFDDIKRHVFFDTK